MKKAFSIIEIVFSIVVISVALISIATISRQNARLNVMAVKQELIKLARTQIMNVISSPWDSSQLISLAVDQNGKKVYEGTAMIAFKIYDLDSNNGEYEKRKGIVKPTSMENWFETRLIDNEAIKTVPPASKNCFGKDACPDNSIGFAWAPDAMNDIDDWDGYEYTIKSVNTNQDAEGTGRTSGDFIFAAKLTSEVNYSMGAIDATNTSGTLTYVFPTKDNSNAPTNTKRTTVKATAFDPKKLDTPLKEGDRTVEVVLSAYSYNIGDALEVASKCWGEKADCEGE